MSRKVANRNAKSKKTVEDLLSIMAKLRSPSGCPWDREQTGQTLKPYLIEEAYEALEAIETGTPEAVKEELGDVLLQIVFQSRIAEEKGEFSFGDVVHILAEKLLRRHPHVFPQAEDKSAPITVRNAKDVTKVWRRVKEREGKYAKRASALDGIPLALPALERAKRMSQRASVTGFDWSNAGDVFAEIRDRLAELLITLRKTSGKAGEEALGSLLFLLAHWADLKGMSAEEALRKANRRFAKRFRKSEEERSRSRKPAEQLRPEQLDFLWRDIPKKRKPE